MGRYSDTASEAFVTLIGTQREPFLFRVIRSLIMVKVKERVQSRQYAPGIALLGDMGMDWWDGGGIV